MPVARFARRAGGHRAIHRHVMPVHHSPEMAEGARSFGNRVVAQGVARERIVAQTHGRAFAIENFVSVGRSSAGNQQPDGIRAGVNRGDIYRGGQFVYRQRCASAPEG